MKKVLIFVLLLFLTASLVYAVGSSTGGSSSSSSSSSGGGGSSVTTVQEPLSCEERTTLKERIKCRFDEGTEEETTPEACKEANEFGKCLNLYADVQPCYEVSGTEKDSCFKQVSGFTKNNLQEQSVLNQAPIKNYIVILLYDLQERIEESYEKGKINSENSSDIITSIVEAKRSILQGESKSKIKSDILIVKNKWDTYMK